MSFTHGSSLGAWSTMKPVDVAGPTRFERLIERLGLAPHEWATSEEVQRFVRLYVRMYYIPENLLDELNIPRRDREGRKDAL